MRTFLAITGICVLLFGAILLLAGAISYATASSHADQAGDMAVVQATLPEGCKLNYAGNVRVEGSHHSSRIFFTTCPAMGTNTTSETHNVPQGKTTRSQTDATIVFDKN